MRHSVAGASIGLQGPHRRFSPAGWPLALLQALTGARRERGIVIALGVNAVLWTLFGTISKFGQWIHGDSAEIFAWSRYLELGYDKHPPLLPALYRAWFTVMPVANWSLYLLAAINVAVGLWAVWRAAGLLVDRPRQVIATAALTLMPFYGFHALQLNHDAILLSLWPLTGLALLVSMRGRWRGTLALGVLAALAMLAKYSSATLLLALAVGALFHPQALRYLRSPHPYVAAAIALALFWPHLDWAIAQDFPSLRLAAERYRGAGPGTPLKSALHYLGAALAFLSLALGAMLAGSWRGRRTDPPAPANGERRVVVVTALLVALLPFMQLPLGQRVPTPWMYPTFFWLPLALLCWPGARIGMRAALPVLGLATLLPLGALAASPLAAYVQMRRGAPSLDEPRILLAVEATRIFRAETGLSLAIAGGGLDIDWISFHSPDHPRVFSTARPPSDFAWLSDARVARRGMAIICGAEEEHCIAGGMTLAPSKRVALRLEQRLFGLTGKPHDYVVMIVPPYGPLALPEEPLQRCTDEEPPPAPAPGKPAEADGCAEPR